MRGQSVEDSYNFEPARGRRIIFLIRNKRLKKRVRILLDVGNKFSIKTSIYQSLAWEPTLKISTILSRIVFCCVALTASVATAVPLTWTLQGVTFDDGGTASGSFIIDSANGDLLSWNITTTAGSSLPGFTFDTTNSSLFGQDVFGVPNAYTITRDTPFAEPYWHMTFDSALTAMGTVNFSYANDLSGSWECNNCTPIRYMTAGSVTTGTNDVPEPAPLALFSIALAGLALRRLKK